MPSLMIDDAMVKTLSMGARIEVRAADGRVVGYVVPASAEFEPPISEEELDRREAEGGGRPLADILRDLEARG